MAVINTYKDNHDGTHTLTIKHFKKNAVVVLIDSKHYDKVKTKKWYVHTKNNALSIQAQRQVGGKRTSISLRRFIAQETSHLNPNRVFLVNSDNPCDLREVNLSNTCDANIFSNMNKDEKQKKLWVDGLKKRYSKDWSKSLAKGNKNYSTVVTKDTVTKIREMASQGTAQTDISRILNLKRTTVADILNYRTWNEYLVIDDISTKFKDEFNKHQLDFVVSSNNTLQDINEYLFMATKFKQFISKDKKWVVNFMVVTEHQFYMEYFHNGNFIGSSQHSINNPYTTKRKSNANHQILQVKKDTFGYAKENDVVLTRERIYTIINGIEEALLHNCF